MAAMREKVSLHWLGCLLGIKDAVVVLKIATQRGRQVNSYGPYCQIVPLDITWFHMKLENACVNKEGVCYRGMFGSAQRLSERTK